MTGKERLLTVLRGGTPDRVPISFFVQEEFLSSFYPHKKKVSRIDDAVRCSEYFGFDVITRDNVYTVPYWLKKSFLDWEVNSVSWTDGGIYHRRTTVETPQKVLEQIEVAPYNPRILSGVHFSTKEYLLKTVEDFEVFRRYMPDLDKDETESRKERAKYTNSVIGNRGISCPWGVGGVYNMAATCWGVQNLLIDPYVRPEFYREMMEFFADWIVRDYELMVETDHDAIGIQGNIANGALMNDAFFREHILPYEMKITKVIRDAGKYSIYHNCGKAKNLYPSYRDLGIDVWETVAPDPMGDNDLKEAREFFGSELILSGNLDQVSFLKTATPEQVKEKVHKIVEDGKPGGAFIFAGSDYLEPETPVRNIRAAISAATEYGAF